MIYLVELWNVKPEWKALSQKERTDYMSNIGPAIQQLLEQGIKVLTWSVNNKDTSMRASYDYFAVWAFPDTNSVNVFKQAVSDAGWYNYFEQVNTKGAENTAQNIISELVKL